MEIPIKGKTIFIYVLKYIGSSEFFLKYIGSSEFFYVGITNDLYKRLQRHKSKFGENIQIECLARTENLDYAQFIEKTIIEVHGRTLENVQHNEFRGSNEPDSSWMKNQTELVLKELRGGKQNENDFEWGFRESDEGQK